MSHFVGFVVITPQYNGYYKDSLEKYDENIEYDEYIVGEVSKEDMARCVRYYTDDNDYTRTPLEDWMKEHSEGLVEKFEEIYSANADDWNSERYRKNDEGVWQEGTTYNPNAKWDWYCVGGRWFNCLKKKDGTLCNFSLLKDIDLTPFKDEDYKKRRERNWKGELRKVLKKDVQWHFTEDSLPFCLVIDGEWYEKGEMGWWGMTSNEKEGDVWNEEVLKKLKELDGDSEVWVVDFHI